MSQDMQIELRTQDLEARHQELAFLDLKSTTSGKIGETWATNRRLELPNSISYSDYNTKLQTTNPNCLKSPKQICKLDTQLEKNSSVIPSFDLNDINQEVFLSLADINQESIPEELDSKTLSVVPIFMTEQITINEMKKTRKYLLPTEEPEPYPAAKAMTKALLKFKRPISVSMRLESGNFHVLTFFAFREGLLLCKDSHGEKDKLRGYNFAEFEDHALEAYLIYDMVDADLQASLDSYWAQIEKDSLTYGMKHKTAEIEYVHAIYAKSLTKASAYGFSLTKGNPNMFPIIRIGLPQQKNSRIECERGEDVILLAGQASYLNASLLAKKTIELNYDYKNEHKSGASFLLQQNKKTSWGFELLFDKGHFKLANGTYYEGTKSPEVDEKDWKEFLNMKYSRFPRDFKSPAGVFSKTARAKKFIKPCVDEGNQKKATLKSGLKLIFDRNPKPKDGIDGSKSSSREQKPENTIAFSFIIEATPENTGCKDNFEITIIRGFDVDSVLRTLKGIQLDISEEETVEDQSLC